MNTLKQPVKNYKLKNLLKRPVKKTMCLQRYLFSKFFCKLSNSYARSFYTKKLQLLLKYLRRKMLEILNSYFFNALRLSNQQYNFPRGFDLKADKYTSVFPRVLKISVATVIKKWRRYIFLALHYMSKDKTSYALLKVAKTESSNSPAC